MTKQKATGVTRIIKATGYSFQGLIAAFQHEAAFRQELVLCFFLIPVALWLDINQLEKALLISSLIMVLIVELMNSAVEAVVDRIGSEHHELSGRAKDIGSAAVFLALLNSVIVWLVILVIP